MDLKTFYYMMKRKYAIPSAKYSPLNVGKILVFGKKNGF